MLKQIALGIVLIAGLLAGSAWADDALNSALFDAIYAGNAQEVQSLISRGADVSVAISNEGKIHPKDLLPISFTPLLYALGKNNKDISRLIAHNMVKFIVPYTWGDGRKGMRYELQTAVGADDIEITEILLQRGAGIAEADPLFSVVKSTAMADFLLAHGANANAKNADGVSALHYMAGKSSLNVPVI